jgi:hypothetical protein
VEERRALGSDEIDDASDIAPGEVTATAREAHSTRPCGSEAKGSEESLKHQSLARQSVTPRHSANHRPLRMTRRSVRPRLLAREARVSDRTMVDTIVVIAGMLAIVSIGALGVVDMSQRQKTVPPTPKRRTLSAPKRSELIAKEKTKKQSAKKKSALDNHFHRTLV